MPSLNFPGHVSIITPVYNAAPYLRTCIPSVLAQSNRNFELLLINDGSTDDSGNICEEYAKQDKRIKVFHTPNKGPSAARNIGLENCKGQYVLFLDADDSLDQNAVSMLVLMHGNPDLVIGNFARVMSETVAISNPNTPAWSLLSSDHLVEYTLSYLKAPNTCPLLGVAWGRLFKTDIIRRNNITFNESLSTFEDVCFLFQYLKHVRTVSFIPLPLYRYMVPYAEQKNYSSACMSIGDNPKKQWGFTEALKHISEFLKTKSITDSEVEKIVSHAYVSFTAIQLVRVCGQLTPKNKGLITEFVTNLLGDPVLERSLKFYEPELGPSKLLPWLMKLKLTWLLIFAAKHKAYKKYGKPKD